MYSSFKNKKIKLNYMFKEKESQIKINGKENIPKDGINIYIANHTCFMDLFLLNHVIDEACISLISANSFFIKDLEKQKVINNLIYPFPLEARGKDGYGDVCINGAAKLLSHKVPLIIFPQGVFDKKGYIAKARTGLVRILFQTLSKTNVKINLVPVAINISNVEDNFLRSYKIWNNFIANISFLPAFSYEKYYNDYLVSNLYEEQNKIYHSLMDELMKQIADALKEKYVDKYNELYAQNGLWLPNGKFVTFAQSQEENLKRKYANYISKLVNMYIKSNIFNK